MRDNYNRLYELYDFVNMLHSAKLVGVSFDDIMGTFGWTRKTTERMLNVVETIFGESLHREYMDDGSRRKLYRLVLPDFSKLPPDFIGQSDIVSLNTAAKLIKNNKDVSQNLKSITAKLENINARAASNATDLTTVTGAVAVSGPYLTVDKEILSELQRAIQECHQVEIEYNGKKTITCPLGFLYGIRNNYLVAANQKYISNPIKYILSDIKSVKITDKSFDASCFDINKYAARSFGVYTDTQDGYDVEWLVKKEAAKDAKKYVFHPSQKIIENPDGTLTIRFHTDGLREMAWHLFTWGGMIKPIKPAELIAEYKNCIRLASESLE